MSYFCNIQHLINKALMEVNKTTLEKILYMARLAPTPKQKAAIHTDLNNMVNWVKKLSAVNTIGVEPLATMSHKINKLRKDVPEKPLSNEKALANNPIQNSNYFQVPIVKE